jgi:hypothetical protein
MLSEMNLTSCREGTAKKISEPGLKPLMRLHPGYLNRQSPCVLV